MIFTNKNNNGFSLASGVIITVIIAGIGLLGYAVYHHGHRTQPPKSAAKPSQSSTAGWRSYTLKVEKLSFKYPANWTIEDDTQAAAGMDSVAVNSPHTYFQVGIGTGTGRLDTDPDTIILGADPITLAGQHDYLVYTAIKEQPAVVSAAYVSTSPAYYTAAPAATYATDKIHGAAAGYIRISVGYNSDAGAGGKVFESLAAAKQDPNYSVARQILTSMRY